MNYKVLNDFINVTVIKLILNEKQSALISLFANVSLIIPMSEMEGKTICGKLICVETEGMSTTEILNAVVNMYGDGIFDFKVPESRNAEIKITKKSHYNCKRYFGYYALIQFDETHAVYVYLVGDMIVFLPFATNDEGEGFFGEKKTTKLCCNIEMNLDLLMLMAKNMAYALYASGELKFIP